MMLSTNYPKNQVMMMFIICFLISCGTVAHNPVTLPEPKDVTVSAIPFVPVQQVTTKPIAIPQIETTKQPGETIDDLVKKGILPPYDTLLQLTIATQKQNIRLVDTSRSRKKQNDSLYSLLKGVNSRLIDVDHKADNYYKRKANIAETQNKNYSKGIDAMIISGFIAFVVIQLLNTYMIYRIKKLTRIY